MARAPASLEAVWRRYDAMEVRLTAPLSERMLDLAAVAPGMRVLDLATGRGEPAVRAARRVAPGGVVVGVDPSEPMLALARERASREGVTGLDLRAVDAASPEAFPGARFDAVLARWGLMYMGAPVDALVAARRAMARGARLVAAVWAEPERVPYFTLPRRVLARYRAVPPVDLDAPGTFYYADAARLARDLERAGLRVEHAEEVELPVMEAATDGELFAWVRAFGMARLLDGVPDAAQRAWERDLAREAEPHRQGGVVRLGGVTRVVVASRAT